MKDFMEMTITEALVFLRESGAGMTQHVVRGADDRALAAVIIVDGEEAQEVLDAIDKLTKDW
jgi:hypothetical protein